jgi:hypothetical protein
MSTAAMNAVEVTKAGVASGILSMTRMVGGTFGVAALGALVTALGRDRLEHLLPQATGGQIEKLAGALGAGGTPQGVDPHVGAAMSDAFVHALQSGMRLGAAVVFVGAFVAAASISSRRPKRADATEAPAAEVAA